MAFSKLLEQEKYVNKNLKIDQLQVYGDLIRQELSVSGAGKSSFNIIFIPLCSAMTRLGVEAITESMGSLLKMQYQVNMNIETLLHETQLVYHGPDFHNAKAILQKAFKLYKSIHCVNGRGGSFVKDRQAKRWEKQGLEPPEDSVVLASLKN